MKFSVTKDSYLQAVDTILNLIGTDVDCAFFVKNEKVMIETSKDEAWLRFVLDAEDIEGEGKFFTKVEYLKVIKPGKHRTLSMQFDENNETLSITLGRSRGYLQLIEEDEAIINKPELVVPIISKIPAKVIKFATLATSFKPLLDSSQPNSIINVNTEEFSLSAYDSYIGTHYETKNEYIKTKDKLELLVEMEYWRVLANKIKPEGKVGLGGDSHFFRVKTDYFDLYHAAIQEDTQDVKEVIQTLKSESASRAVIEFDGNAVTEAITFVKSIIKTSDKDEACFYITLRDKKAFISAESSFGKMEADFDVLGLGDGGEEINFQVSAGAFADVLKLTRDEAMKYGPAKLTVTEEYLIMESLKVPASSVSPLLGE